MPAHRRLRLACLSAVAAAAMLFPHIAAADVEFLLSISWGGSGIGNVTSQDLEMDCSAPCSHSYPADTHVILSATPDGDSVFAGWAGSCGGSDSCLVSMDQARTVIANFATPCASGTYSNSGDDRVGCTPSPAGHYVELPGTTGPSECPLGTFQPNTGQEACLDADPGHFVDVTASIAQTECQPGSYQPEYRSASCIAASKGYYVSASAAASQTRCPVGTTTASTGSTCAAACSATAPSTTNVTASLRTGAPATAPITIAWNATDDATNHASLFYQVESRRLKNGAWSAWTSFTTSTGVENVNRSLPYGSYVQLRVRTRNQAGLWSPWANSAPFRMLALRTPSFSFSGAWTKVPGNSWGMLRRTSVAGSTATLSFNGTAVGAVLRAGHGQGTALVCVDPGTPSATCKSVNLTTFVATDGRVLASAFNGLAPGAHVVRVTVESGSIDLLGAVVKTARP